MHLHANGLRPHQNPAQQIISRFCLILYLLHRALREPCCWASARPREGSPRSKTTSGQEAANQASPARDFCNIIQQESSHSLGEGEGNQGRQSNACLVCCQHTVGSFFYSLSPVNDKGKGSRGGIGVFLGFSLAAAPVSKHTHRALREGPQQWALPFQRGLIS